MTPTTPIGYIISWQVPAAVRLDHLRQGLSSAGFNAHDLAPDLNAASLVARAAGLIAKHYSGQHGKRLARKVEHATRQITRENTDATGLVYTREAGIAFDDTTGKLTSAELYVLPWQLEVESTRTAGDVTRIIQRIVEQAGSDLIPVREQGGAYFIPRGHEIIGRVREVLETVGGTLVTFACTLGHGSTESVANVITDYLLKQIDELHQSVEELNEAGIRSDVKSRRLSRVADLRERLGAYASLILTQSAGLTTALDRAETALLAKLGKTEESQPAATSPESDVSLAEEPEPTDAERAFAAIIAAAQ